MKRKHSLDGLGVRFGLALVFMLGEASAFAQGSLTPPGAPAPTMKSLDQVEARTAITNAASLVTISQPGSYYLTRNLTVSTGDGIDITTNGVTLDLNGFTISSTAASATGYGIYLVKAYLSDITICNGHIRGGVTNNGSGTYNGRGFAAGINNFGALANVLVFRVSVSGCQYYGIALGLGDSTVVDSCTVRTVGSFGISASTIKSCSAIDCGDSAIVGDQVSDCRGQSSGSGYGLKANTVLNCYGYSSGGGGLAALATAQNCYAQSSSGIGLYANTAQNCYGVSSTSTGLYAENTAENCYGHSASGDGVYAVSAQNCVGFSSSSGDGVYTVSAQNCYGISGTGNGIFATTALNCFGATTGLSAFGVRAITAQNCSGQNFGGGTGLYGEELAIGCYGYANSGTGLSAGIANSCHGTTTSGTAQAFNFKCNMP